MAVPLNSPVDWEPRTEKVEEIGRQNKGRFSLFMGNGTSAGFVVPYGRVTEDMSYPTFAEVVPEDMPILCEVGERQWQSMLHTNEIIIAEFRREGA